MKILPIILNFNEKIAVKQNAFKKIEIKKKKTIIFLFGWKPNAISKNGLQKCATFFFLYLLSFKKNILYTKNITFIYVIKNKIFYFMFETK